MSERAMRPFWVHQLAEVILGVALIAQGMQSPEPIVPLVAGTAVVLNAAATRGPLGAFRVIGRGVHRWIDLGVMAAIVVGALQPWWPVDAVTRGVMLVLVVPLAFLWFYTDWAERPARSDRRAATAGPTSEAVGRGAGRAAGGAYAAARRGVDKRRKPGPPA